MIEVRKPPREYKVWASLEAMEADPPEDTEAFEELHGSPFRERNVTPLSSSEKLGMSAVYLEGTFHVFKALLAGAFCIALLNGIAQTYREVSWSIEATVAIIAAFLGIIALVQALKGWGYFRFNPRAR